MRPPINLRPWFLLGLVAASGTAQAGRPFATEDAGILDKSDCEWESFAARAKAKGQSSETGWSTQIGCGIGLKTQLALAVSRSKSEGEQTSAWAIGGKTGLVDGGEDSTSLALAYGGSAAKAPGDGSYRWNTTFVNLVATRPLSKDWTLHANLGWTRDRTARADSTTYALAAEWALSEAWAVGAEVYGDDRNKPWVGTGIRWTLSKAWSVNASHAVNRESPRTTATSVGFKLAF